MGSVKKKEKPIIHPRKLEFDYSPSAFKSIRPYQSCEIEPVLSRLFRKNMAENKSLSKPKRYNRDVNELVTNYILIRNVGALEYYLRQIASKIVDNNNVTDFSQFFNADFEATYAQVNQGKGKRRNLTRGQVFASQYNFANPEETNWVFSRLLGLDFFETIKKINRYPIKNPWPGSRGLVRNWKNFMKMFEWRNEIVHSMKHVQLTKTELVSLCSNTLVFMEQASILVDPPTGLGESAEQDHFYRVIDEQKANYSKRHQRTGNDRSSNLRPISTTIDNKSTARSFEDDPVIIP
jgi:hypothetical protein